MTLHRWGAHILEEGASGLAVERRGRSTKMDNPNKGRPRKKPLPPERQQDIIDELQKAKRT